MDVIGPTVFGNHVIFCQFKFYWSDFGRGSCGSVILLLGGPMGEYRVEIPVSYCEEEMELTLVLRIRTTLYETRIRYLPMDPRI